MLGRMVLWRMEWDKMCIGSANLSNNIQYAPDLKLFTPPENIQFGGGWARCPRWEWSAHVRPTLLHPFPPWVVPCGLENQC